MRVSILLIVLLAAVVPAHAAVSERGVTYKRYAVRPLPAQSLRSALNATTPIRQDGAIYHGFADWHVNWQFYWLAQPDQSCVIRTVATEISASITLPELISSDAALQAQFAPFFEALRTHERGHVEIGTAAAYEIDRQIAALPAMASCRALEAEANRIGYATLEAYQSRDREYDLQTEHGKSQGAWLQL